MNAKEINAYRLGFEDAADIAKATVKQAVKDGKQVGRALSAATTNRKRALDKQWTRQAADDAAPKVRKLRARSGDNGAAGEAKVKMPRLTKSGKRIGRPPTAERVLKP